MCDCRILRLAKELERGIIAKKISGAHLNGQESVLRRARTENVGENERAVSNATAAGGDETVRECTYPAPLPEPDPSTRLGGVVRLGVAVAMR